MQLVTWSVCVSFSIAMQNTDAAPRVHARASKTMHRVAVEGQGQESQLLPFYAFWYADFKISLFLNVVIFWGLSSERFGRLCLFLFHGPCKQSKPSQTNQSQVKESQNIHCERNLDRSANGFPLFVSFSCV